MEAIGRDGRRARGALVAAALACALAVAACGKRSDERGSGVPSDLDSMAFQPESAQVRADIDSGNAQYIRAWVTGSGDLFANCYTEDGTALLPGGRLVQGRDSITAHMGRVFTQVRMRRGSITTTGLRIEGDRAHETGRWMFELVPARGGRAEVDSGQYEEMWKYESGQWKMWRDMKARGDRTPGRA